MRRISKFQLMDLFFNRARGNLYASDGRLYTGIISAIQHEDGSGSSFNVVLENGMQFHMRTID